MNFLTTGSYFKIIFNSEKKKQENNRFYGVEFL